MRTPEPSVRSIQVSLINTIQLGFPDVYSAVMNVCVPTQPCDRYAAQRQQFGPPDAAEVSVLDYQSTQAKLMPLLATAYGLHFAKVGSVGPRVFSCQVSVSVSVSCHFPVYGAHCFLHTPHLLASGPHPSIVTSPQALLRVQQGYS